MRYPTLKEVEGANREQIYRWFLLLPFPVKVKTGKGKAMKYSIEPYNGTQIMNAIFMKWKEFGGGIKNWQKKF